VLYSSKEAGSAKFFGTIVHILVSDLKQNTPIVNVVQKKNFGENLQKHSLIKSMISLQMHELLRKSKANIFD
jgi:hypothetical protein